jgi:hypothetical protein
LPSLVLSTCVVRVKHLLYYMFSTCVLSIEQLCVPYELCVDQLCNMFEQMCMISLADVYHVSSTFCTTCLADMHNVLGRCVPRLKAGTPHVGICTKNLQEAVCDSLSEVTWLTGYTDKAISQNVRLLATPHVGICTNTCRRLCVTL